MTQARTRSAKNRTGAGPASIALVFFVGVIVKYWLLRMSASDRTAQPLRRDCGKLLVVAVGDVRLRLCAGAVVRADLRGRWASTTSLQRRRGAANTQVDTGAHASRRVRRQRARPPWNFRPRAATSRCIRASSTHGEYEFGNIASAPVTGQAIPSYAPQAPAQSSTSSSASASRSRRCSRARRGRCRWCS